MVARDEAATSGRPLSGRTVVVTRTADQATGLIEPLEALGAEVILMPVIAVADPLDWAPVDAAIRALPSYDWVVLTSANGVDWFDERLRSVGRTLAEVEGPRFAVVGSVTAEHLLKRGVEPALVPAQFRAEGLVEAFASLGAASGPRVLILRAEEAREVLPDELRALGFEVDVVPVYRLITAIPPPGALERLRAGGVNAVTFASGGTARRFVETLRNAGMDAAATLAGLSVVSIGPVTTDALRDMGIAVDAEAPIATAEAMAAAVVGALSGGAR